MLRNDIFCLYKGKEYRFVRKADGKYEIVTKDKSKIDDTFNLYRNEIYRKQVDINKINEVYSITSYAVYKGNIFEITRSVGNDVELFTSNFDLAHEYKMKQIGKNEYVKVVSVKEVEIFEKRKLLDI